MGLSSEESVSELIAACTSESPEVRFKAVWALGKTGHPDAFETILRLTSDTDARVRYDATLALGVLGDPRGIAVLLGKIEAGDDEDGAAYAGLTHLLPAAFQSIAASYEKADSGLRLSLLDVIGPYAETHGLPEAMPLIERARLDADPAVRASAEYWFNEICSPERRADHLG